MDPNANFRERIGILRDAGSLVCLNGPERDRFDYLTNAYAEWRATGGFVADRALRSQLLSMVLSDAREGHRAA